MVLVVVGWTEFWVELWLWPGLKTASWLWLAAALLLIVVGHVFRIGAMWTAKHHFTHQIRDDRHEGHELVTTGLYRYTVLFVGCFALLVSPQSEHH